MNLRKVIHPLQRLIILALAAFLAMVIAGDVCHVSNINPPSAAQVDSLIVLDQNWSAQMAHRFHTTSQGTMIMPTGWFTALEQPDLRLLSTPHLLCEPDYLQRFGFIYEEQQPDNHTSPPILPIGFAIEPGFRDPHGLLRQQDVVGLTCAACHTSQLNYHGTGIRIEGGPANVDLGLFQSAVGRSLAFTLYVPTRLDRFAHKVLREHYDESKAADLQAEFRQFVEGKVHELQYADRAHLYDLQGGNGRTDALGLIGNRTFTDLDNAENLAVTSAPVNFPPLWDAPWFEWVQYNASIRPPMARNIGEALGVGALVVTNQTSKNVYDSTVNIENLHSMETWLAGPRPFNGLRPPKWPTKVLGELKLDHLKAGKILYAKNCKGCHPLAEELCHSYVDHRDTHWIPADPNADRDEFNGMRLLQLPVVNLHEIGTDPAQALNMHKRVVYTSDGVFSEGVALMLVTAGVRERKYKELGIDQDSAKVDEYDSHRPMPRGSLVDWRQQGKIIADNLGYRSRPLDGVWATAPYLHNGSVPNLYEMLLPVARRSKTFYVGGREFDPVRVGFHVDASHGSFLFDTAIPGNLNQGHEFRNLTLEEVEDYTPESSPAVPVETNPERWARALQMSPQEYDSLSPAQLQERVHERSAILLNKEGDRGRRPGGVLGPDFTDSERWALIEYLKSL